MHGGEFAFAYQHLAWVCEVHEEVGALMAEHIETKRDESMECQSRELWEEIKREMEEVAKETDIAFATDFWMSPMGERVMTMSMHWIT